MTYLSTENKTAAIVSYLTIIGFIIALILHSKHKSYLSAFHLRQALGFNIAFIGVSIVAMLFTWIPIFGTFVQLCVNLTAFIFMVIGVLTASQGKSKPLPFIGEFINRAFSSLF